MKLNLNMDKKVTVITKNATPYEIDGNSGITYRLVIMHNDDVEKVKCVSREVYDAFQAGGEYLLTGEMDVRNGRVYEWKVNGSRNTSR